MYKVKHYHFTVEDRLENLDKILSHPNILIKEFKREQFWTNYLGISDEYKSHDNTTIASIDCYLKVKHSRRLKEMEMLWKVTAEDVLSVVK